MKDKIELIRNEIKRLGFMNETKITIKAQLEWSFSKSSISQLLNEIPNGEIYQIEYTNIWIEPYATRMLFFYHPVHKE